MARDVARLRDEVGTLKAQGERDRRRIEGLETQLRETSKSGTAAAPRTVAIPENLAVVRVAPSDVGADEESSAFIVDVGDGGSVAPRVSSMRTGFDRRVGGAGADAAPPLPTAVELRDPLERLGPPADYLAAEEALRAGDAARAAALFEAFVAAAPQHSLADNALLARGNALVQIGDWSRALAAYERVATGYPAGDALPEALLRYGETCLELGRKAAARAAFRRVVEDHPGSAPAEAATGRLAGL